MMFATDLFISLGYFRQRKSAENYFPENSVAVRLLNTRVS